MLTMKMSFTSETSAAVVLALIPMPAETSVGKCRCHGQPRLLCEQQGWFSFP